MTDVGIAHVIQLAIAPVFLLTGVGALLAVLTNRLARIIDRARRLEDALLSQHHPERHERWHKELRTLSQRSRLINWAISLAVLAALLVCLVIVGLFMATVYSRDVDVSLGWLFIATMMALIGALITFLREIYIATATLRFGLN